MGDLADRAGRHEMTWAESLVLIQRARPQTIEATDPRMGASGKTVSASVQRFALICLHSFAGAQGVCWPSITTLAEMMLMDDRHVRRCLRALEVQGLILVTDRASASGKQTSNTYNIQWDALAKLADDHKPGPPIQMPKDTVEGGATPPPGGGHAPPTPGPRPPTPPTQKRAKSRQAKGLGDGLDGGISYLNSPLEHQGGGGGQNATTTPGSDVSRFRSIWEPAFQRVYPAAYYWRGKDAKVAKDILARARLAADQAGMDLWAVVASIVDWYLADRDRLVVAKGHDLGMMTSGLTRYLSSAVTLGARSGPAAGSRPGATAAPASEGRWDIPVGDRPG